jgi:hypothetical protein
MHVFSQCYTYSVTVARANQVVLFREIYAVFCRNYMKLEDMLWEIICWKVTMFVSIQNICTLYLYN